MIQDQPITAVAFWFRNWCGAWGPVYVNRLYRAVVPHLTSLASGGKFVLFTDRPMSGFLPGIEVRGLSQFAQGLKWNLVKMFMFSGEAGLDGQRVFCFDLDTVIVGDISGLLGYRGRFGVCEAAYSPGAYGGSFISFRGGDEELRERLWMPLRLHHHPIVNRTQGSERLWYREALASMSGEVDFWQRLYPGEVASYKVDCRPNGGPPPGTTLVRFHGKPRPHEVNDQWVKDHWANEP
jgi:hypothetical protein